MIRGIDRSHHNAKIPLASLTPKGVQFIWFKATQGLTYNDSTFQTSWKEAGSILNLKRGMYHFFDPRVDGVAQAKHYLSFGIDFHAKGVLPPCVDVEDLQVVNSAGQLDKAATDAANKWVAANHTLALQRLNDFLAYVKQQTGKDCIIYTYNNYPKEYFPGARFPNNPMWLSSLQSTCPVRYDTGALPEFWQDTYAWNKSDMDGDWFTGTQEQLNAISNS